MAITMAEKFGITPWAFLEECTEEWWNRMVEYNKARSDG
jgi:hypothetical protein